MEIKAMEAVMEVTTKMRSDAEVQDKIRETGERYFLMAEKLFGRTLPRPVYRFDLRGTTGGMACIGRGSMRFNMHIAHTHFDAYIARTVPHEVAHMVEYDLYGTGGHKAPWKRIMRGFGCEASRCHSYDDLRTASGKKRPKVSCGCGEREIGVIKYKRLVSGESSYRCGKCKQSVTPINGAVVDSKAVQRPPAPRAARKVRAPNVSCECGRCTLGPTQLKRLEAGRANYLCRHCGVRVKAL